MTIFMSSSACADGLLISNAHGMDVNVPENPMSRLGVHLYALSL